MANVALAIDILARDKATATLDKVSDSIGRAAKVGSFLGSAAGNLASKGLESVKSFATGSVDAFAAVEDATGAAGVQFGTALPQVVKFADQAAGSFGLSKRAALDAQNTFGTLGKAAGLQGAPLAGFSQKLTGLAGDLASFKGTSTEQAIEAVGAALRGESEPIRAYGVMLNDASIQAEGLALGLVKPVVNADKLRAANLRVTVATAALTKAIKDHGKGSIEAQKAQGALVSAQNAAKDAAAGSVGPLSATNKTLAIQSLILKQTKDAQGDYARTSTSTANTQKTLAAETENAQAKLGQKLAPAITAVRQAFLVGIRSLSGFATGVAAVSGFVDDNAGKFKILAGVITAILLPTLISAAVKYTTLGVQATISAAKQVASWLLVQLQSIATAGILALNFALTVAGWIGAGIAATANAAIVVAGWVLMGVQSTLQAARMAAAWLIALGPIAWVTAAVVAIGVLIYKNWDTIKNATAVAWSWVANKVAGVVTFLKNLFLNFTGPGLLIKHWDSIVNTIKGLPRRISNAASGMFDGIKNAFRSAINWIIGKWNGLQFKLPSVDTHIPGVGKVGGFTLGTPDIPKLAKGGIVRSPTLALIGEAGPEAVVPLGRGVGGGGGNINITFTGLVTDPLATAREVEKVLTKLRRERGTSLGFA